jgi:hypothetical protein
MRRITKTLALAGLTIAGAGGTASAQQVQQGVTYYQPSTPATYRPAPGTQVVRQGDPRAVLPAFSRRGGVGTTPYLGNTRGLGGFSTNYDAPPRAATTAAPARRWRLFGRNR